MPVPIDSLDLTRLSAAYRSGSTRPSEIIATVLDRMSKRGDDKVWIDVVPRAELEARAAELDRQSAKDLPLYGVPFAIKDNIDLAGRPTTAACPDYAYTAESSAPVVQRLIDAGAVAIGKTNMDQFATGLVGTRSPHGACANAFDERYISGGSSSGSAIAVASGLVSFALGTDTAGSGRVPAAFNNIVGLKPSLGLLPTRGVVPACRTLDCVSIFALTVADARTVLQLAEGFDRQDPYSRAPADTRSQFGEPFRFGVPRAADLEFFGDRDYQALYSEAIARLQEMGGQSVEIDFAPFLETARLLYEGPWVAERWLVIRDLLARKPQAVNPVVREVIEKASTMSAADAFEASYRLKALRRMTETTWSEVDVLLTPSTATIYTLSQVEADPVALNSRLGYYTNFVNLLDLSALAVPAGFRPDGLPFGITLVAPAFSERALCELATRIQRDYALTLGATGSTMPPQDATSTTTQISNAGSTTLRRDGAGSTKLRRDGAVHIAVCGAHMSGLPLNHQLTDRGARLVRTDRSAPHYRLFALEAFLPPRPGMIRDEQGAAIELEVWEMPAARFGDFVDGIPAPLGIGTVELSDGQQVRGFLCEHYATRDAREITEMGSWRTYLSSRREGNPKIH